MALTQTAKTQLYQFFAIAFDAAPGVTYLSQLAAAYDSGMSVKTIVNVFTQKAEFLSVYPNFLTDDEFATKLITNVVGTSATQAARDEAIADVKAALGAKMTRGDVIFNVFNNLAAKLTDAKWGGTANLMANQVEYARYFTETLGVDTTNLQTLQAVIANVTPTSSKDPADIASTIDAAINPTFGLTVSAPKVTEGDAGTKTLSYVLTLSSAPTAPIVVNYSVDEKGSSATAGDDYASGAGAVSFAAGQTSAVVSITVNADDLAEGDETVKVNFSGSRITSAVSATGTITDDDAVPVIASQANRSVSEGSTQVGAVVVTDADTDPSALKYSIAGIDSGMFNISSTGALSFKAAPDFEMPADDGADNTYNLAVTVSDGTNRAVQNISVKVNNVNEPPALTSGDKASVLENAPATTTVVYTASATDVDRPETLTYSLKSGGDADMFTIDATTGAVTLKSSANFEAKASYAFTVVVTDAGGLAAERAVSVSVTDVNEAPAFAAATATASTIAENGADGAMVFTASAKDVDAGDAVAYSLGGADAAKFGINATTGAVTLTKAADFETQPSYTFTVTATDKAGLTATQTVTLGVSNVNEAPAFGSATATAAAIAENGAAGAVVYTASATDVDAGDMVAYSLTGADASKFSVDSSGKVSIVASANFEAQKSYSFNVVATDKGGLTATQAVSLAVTDVNEAPAYKAATATATTIAENGADGVTVFTASAADVDAGDAIAYSLGGADASKFSIDAATGAVTLTKAANFEAQPSYSFNVIATDKGGLTASQAVTLGVSNVNEAPTFGSPTATATAIAENGAAGAVVYTASATDVDAGDMVAYSLSGADADKFNVDASGKVSIVAPANFEAQKSYSFNVVATDKGGLSATQAITLAVTDVNEAPTFATAAATATAIAENGPANAVIFTASASDVDAGDTRAYSLTGADAAKFTIDAATGAVSLKGSADFETQSSYAFNVVATDKGGLTATQAVTLAVTDVNEVPAFAAGATATRTVNENTKAVGNSAAADVDAADKSLSYAASGTNASSFDIDAATGALSFKSAPNFELDGRSYTVVVTATDKGGLSASQTITVNVADVNEAPSFVAPAATLSVAETGNADTKAGTAGPAVGNAAATDVDAGDGLVYSLSGTHASSFNINSSTGALSFKATPDFEKDALLAYNVIVTATDKAGLAASQNVTINVTDVNDEKPVVTAFTKGTADNVAISIDLATEITPTGAAVKDSDANDSFTVNSATLINTNNQAIGQVSFSGTQITYNPDPTFLSGSAFIQYTVKDKAGNVSLPATATVVVNTVNSAPVLVANQVYTINENSTAGKFTSGGKSVVVLFSDQESNSVTDYEVTGGTGSGIFAVDRFTGELSYTGSTPLNFEGTPSYTLEVQARDTAPAPLKSAKGTITINLANVNEAVTVTSGATGTIAENAPTSTVAYTVTSTDVDAGDTATYSLKAGGDSALFNIDSKTGDVTLKASANFEAKSSYAITVVATDAGGLTNEKAVTINVTDVNEAPAFVAPGTATVAENAPAATLVWGLGLSYFPSAATDVDAGDQLTYTLEGADAAAFNINSLNGNLTLKDSANFEAKSSYAINVVATDKGGLKDTKALTVTVTDVNEAPTFATASATAAAIAENGAANATVFTAAATDVDAGSKITYTLGGADAALFSIDGTTGVVKINAAANFEAKNSYAFNVIATDNGTPGLAATQAVSLAVTDVNEAPTVTSVATGAIDENAAVATVAYTATSADVDAGDAATYSLKAGVGDADMLSINATTGAVTLKASANFEVKNSYSFTVVATDKGGLSAEKAVTVAVNDKNDAPVAQADSTSVLTGVLKTIDVLANDTDEDAGDTKTIVASKLTQPTKGGVAVVNNGKIDYTSAVGYVGQDTFTYTMRDTAGVESTATVTVSVSSNTGGTSADDTLYGTTAAENIDGAGGNDTIVGGGGADTLIGNEGNDRITYRDTISQMLGGAGVDTLVLDSSAVAAKFNFSNNNNQLTDTLITDVNNGVNKSLVVLGMENIDASASSRAVTIDAVASTTSSIVLGSQGDTISSLANATGALSITLGAGNDSVIAGASAANITFDAGAGNDTVNASLVTGAVTATMGAGNDSISTAGGNDSIDAGADNDTVATAGGNDTISGGEGDDTIDAGAGTNSVDAGAGNDSVTAGDADDTVTGGVGDDTINAGSGNNNVSAGDGNDSVTTGASGNDTITGGIGNDTITANAGSNSVDGGDGADSISAGGAADTIVGGAGADSIVGGGGADSILSGDGNDRITFANLAAIQAAAKVDGGADVDTVVITAGATITDPDLTALVGIEALNVAGGASNITLGSNANSAGLATLTFGASNDTVNTSAAAYTLNLSVNLGGGNDTALLGSGNDTVTMGGVGGQTISTGAGNDLVVAGTSLGAGGNDTLAGGSGTDTLSIDGGAAAGGTSTQTINFGTSLTEFETITLAAGLAVSGSTAGSVNNYDLTLGNNNIAAGTTLTVNAGALRAAVVTNLGTDNALGGATNTTASDTTTDETLTFTAAAVTTTGAVNVTGGGANDNITGTANADTISGGAGNDTMRGGGGADSLSGGEGNDQFLVSSAQLTAAARIDGGANSTAGDSIVADNGSTLTDSMFANAVGIEALSFGAGGAANSATLGTAAETAGIRAVTAGANGDTISVAAYASNGVNLSGGAGADTLTGSGFADTISGGAGNDSVSAGAGADSITTSGNDTVNAGAGNDTITLGTGVDSVDGGADDDLIVGGANVAAGDSLAGGAGNDTLSMSAGATATNNVLNGVVAAQITFAAGGLTGIETITLAAGLAVSGSTAGSANDYDLVLNAANVASGAVLTVNASGLRAGVVTNLGTDNALGGATGTTASDTTTDENLAFNASALGTANGAVNVTGGGAADTIRGGANNDTISAGEGDDSVQGGAGNDSIDLGVGANTADLGDGNDTVTAGSGNDSITDGGGNDSITVGDGNNTVAANAGDDTVTAGAGNDSVDGAAGNDSLSVGDGNNTVTGGAGNDTIVAGAGSDDITGGGGADRITMGGGSDILRVAGSGESNGGASDTVTDFVSGTDAIVITVSDTGTAADVINVSSFASVTSYALGLSTLSGQTSRVIGDGFYSSGDQMLAIDVNGDGLINEAGSADIQLGIAAVAASDLRFNISSGDGNDTVTGGGSNDTINAGIGDDVVTAGDGNDSVLGGNGDDSVTAGDGNDTVAGDAGNDTVLGGNGNDSLTGGAGTDSLTGGSGVDTYALGSDGAVDTVAENGTAVSKTALNITGFDLITGFTTGQDVLTFVGTNAKQLAGTYNAGTGVFVVGAAAGDNDVIVWADTNNDNVVDAGELAVVLVGVAAAGGVVDTNGAAGGNGP